ncbi:hypothetical protein K438DRAFT_1765033 [Mycena galopus ATCC 62051]|nr:hypothetical protein K438DRAFT_1765033 [Mycena galopus ATCC 62051]
MPGFDPDQPRNILPLAAFGYTGYYPFVINTHRRKDKRVDEYGNAYARRIGAGSQPSEAINVDGSDEERTDGRISEGNELSEGGFSGNPNSPVVVKTRASEVQASQDLDAADSVAAPDNADSAVDITPGSERSERQRRRRGNTDISAVLVAHAPVQVERTAIAEVHVASSSDIGATRTPTRYVGPTRSSIDRGPVRFLPHRPAHAPHQPARLGREGMELEREARLLHRPRARLELERAGLELERARVQSEAQNVVDAESEKSWGQHSHSVDRDVPSGYESMACPICQNVMSHPVLNDQLEHAIVLLFPEMVDDSQVDWSRAWSGVYFHI